MIRILALLLLTHTLAALESDVPLLYLGRIHPAYAYEKFSTDKEREVQPLEADYPLRQRLIEAGSTYKALPGRYKKGEWYSLNALKLDQAGNFTLYSDSDFGKIKSAYLAQDEKALSSALKHAYETLAGKLMLEAHGKGIYYPTFKQLQGEILLIRFPFIEGLILLYLLSFLFKTRFIFSAAFALHTAYLLLRCFVLGRPPVSNMLETLIYVPWVVAFTGLFILNRAASLTSLLLLLVLAVSPLKDRFENVQAVLDSQYWLLVHVLMVVGSYGFFLLSGVAAHFYLLSKKNQEVLSKPILHSLYIGTGLLIVGTILGGVWAAESWGRFWDWDPKESWAFISCCLYLTLVHLHRFHQIGGYGLAIGAIVGLQVITFTWYGVNYILGQGLHSYGFGSGGTLYYLAFVLLEISFLALALLRKKTISS